MTRAQVAIPTAGDPSASVIVRASIPSLVRTDTSPLTPPRSAEATRLRDQLGLPTDRPIVMSGHQAEWWHPGILAKLFAARAIADRIGGVVVWLVVDQDDNDPGAIRIPTLRDNRTVTTTDHRLAPESHAATGWRPPITQITLPDLGAIAAESARAGITRIGEAMRARASERTLARQLGLAAIDLATHVVRTDHVIFASDLAATDAWAALIGRMAADPEACIRAYNEPASRLPADQIRALGSDPARNRWELPVWSIDAGGGRSRVWSDSPALDDPTTLLPRALSMTALVRTLACEMFIHGTGGEAYDTVTDQWIPAWLGVPVAPTGMATATLHLPLDRFSIDAGAVRQATARAHKARHDPAVVGEEALRAKKLELVDRIRADRAAGGSGREGYLALHRMLESYRADHAEELARLAAIGAESRDAYRRSRRTILARDWPFPFYDSAALAGVGRAIAASVGG